VTHAGLAAVTGPPAEALPVTAPLEIIVLGATIDDPPPDLPLSDPGLRIRFADDLASLRAVVADAEVILHWASRTDALRQVWPQASRLRWIMAAGVGVEWALFPELVASDVIVTNCRGVFDVAMPEYVLALVLALAKDIPGTVRHQDQRRWHHRPLDAVAGSRALVVGAGSIGRATARLLEGIGMEVRLVARRARPARPGAPEVLAADDLARLLPDADWLILVLPLNEGTEGLIGARELALLPRGARLVNVGRGRTVDEAALVEAVRTDRLGGAALDVFVEEPLPAGHTLWQLPNVLVSPHIGGDVHGWLSWFTRAFIENLERFRDGRPLANVIDKRLGYVVDPIEGATP
jgi:phosphoglycerate dehydrogenase-like enzyme